MRPFAAQHTTRGLFDPLQILHGTGNVQLGRQTIPAKRHVHVITTLPFPLGQSFRLALTAYPVAGRDHFLVANKKALTLSMATCPSFAVPQPLGAFTLIGSFEFDLTIRPELICRLECLFWGALDACAPAANSCQLPPFDTRV